MRPNEFIEEAIEESYLLGLSDREILANLDRFIDTCISVIQAHVHDRKQMQMLAEKLAQARVLNRIENRRDNAWDAVLPEQHPSNRLAERAARSKRAILSAIAECDPSLVERIDQARFPNSPIHSASSFYTRFSFRMRFWLVQMGFLILLLTGLLLAYWIFTR